MAHEYSVLVHDYLKEKIEMVKKEKKAALDIADEEKAAFFNGQLDEFLSLRQYLTDNIDLDTQKYYD